MKNMMRTMQMMKFMHEQFAHVENYTKMTIVTIMKMMK